MKPCRGTIVQTVACVLTSVSLVLAYRWLDRPLLPDSFANHPLNRRFASVEIDPRSPATIRASLEKLIGPISVQCDPDDHSFELGNPPEVPGHWNIQMYTFRDISLQQLLVLMRYHFDSAEVYFHPPTNTFSIQLLAPRHQFVFDVSDLNDYSPGWEMAYRHLLVPPGDMPTSRSAEFTPLGSQLFVDGTDAQLADFKLALEFIRAVELGDYP